MQNREIDMILNETDQETPIPEGKTDALDQENIQVFTDPDHKHADSVKTEAQKLESDINKKLDQASTEAQVKELIQQKMKVARRLTPEECLFCENKAVSFEKNLVHMQKEHSFFIPDSEYLVDLPGLIEYLGEKITVANVCLYCNGRGRGMRSLEAVRKHMTDKGHCKIAYDTEIDILEISDYYDFSSSYPEQFNNSHSANEFGLDEEGEGMDADSEMSKDDAQRRNINSLYPSGSLFVEDEETGELVLPNGNRIGHRSLNYIYKQNLNVSYEKESVHVNRMHLITGKSEADDDRSDQEDAAAGANKVIRYTNNGVMIKAPQSKAVIMSLPGGKQIWKDMATFKEKRRFADFKARVGIKANKLQKYFRYQNPV
ncbi:hypothetical protein BB560_004852 [Smittium megazygosporum]|nr:hypothetical protein BB560_004852 [Smittium megazygosporum]